MHVSATAPPTKTLSARKRPVFGRQDRGGKGARQGTCGTRATVCCFWLLSLLMVLGVFAGDDPAVDVAVAVAAVAVAADGEVAVGDVAVILFVVG